MTVKGWSVQRIGALANPAAVGCPSVRVHRSLAADEAADGLNHAAVGRDEAQPDVHVGGVA